MLKNSRFNPKPGIADFINEFRKPNPYRWPMLAAAMVPFGVIFLWLNSETHYGMPDSPDVTYITTYAADRTDEEIIASNEANQILKDEREAQLAELEERKRDAYKALGAATGLDVQEMERRAEIDRAAEAEEEAARRAELYTAGSGPESANDRADPEASNTAETESAEP